MKKNRMYRFWISALTLILGLTTHITGQTVAQASENTAESISVDVSELFSDRDLAGTYDDSEAVDVILEGDTASCGGDGVTISGSTVTITKKGVYRLSGTLSGMVIVDAGEDKVQLVLDGAVIESAESAAIYVRQADKVFITLAEGSENALSNGGTYTAIDDNKINAVVFSKDDLTLNGSGSLKVNAKAGSGISCKDDMVITGGVYTVNAEKHGIAAKDSLAVSDGTFIVTSGEDGVRADNDDDESKGSVYIGGGTFTISAADDGLHASAGLIIADGTIDIVTSEEGLEGLTVDILGGEISVASSDDGINAAGGASSSVNQGRGMFENNTNAWIRISGGTVYVNAGGDGLDSNGSILMTDGVVYVAGPENEGNGALDYNGTATITGGYILAVGTSSMTQNFSAAENQGSMLVNTGNQQAGTAIVLKDASGTEIINWTSAKAYSSVLISAPAVQSGETYTLTAGGYSGTIAMDGSLYGQGGGFGGMRGFGGRNGFGGPNGFGGQNSPDGQSSPDSSGDQNNSGGPDGGMGVPGR